MNYQKNLQNVYAIIAQDLMIKVKNYIKYTEVFMNL